MPDVHRAAGTILFLTVLSLFLGACDSGPGATTLDGDPPVLSDFTFDPHQVATTSEDGDVVTFPLNLRVAVNDVDDEIAEVAFVLRSPVAGVGPIAEGRLDPVGGGYFETTTDVSIPRGEVGLYTVLVYAVDQSGSLSNDVRGNLRFVGTGKPPVIEEIVVPDTLKRPAPGEDPKQFAMIAVVSDPDGVSNISRVQFWNVEDPASKIDMFDDGRNGDEAASDGRFTRVVQISSANRTGENHLRFQAVDKTGLESNVAETVIVVVE